jgi:hypothetical protein
LHELFASGRATDLVLLVVAVEAAALLALRLRTGRGLGPLDVFGQLGSGVLLVLAVRSALTGADYRWTALLLAASLPVHLFDLVRRLRASGSSGKGDG